MAESVKSLSKNSLAQMTILLIAGVALASAASAQTLTDPTRPYGITFDGLPGTAVESGPALQSIMITPQKRTAIINGQSVTIGSEIGSDRVIKISDSEVVLARGGEMKVLKLFSEIEKKPSVVAIAQQSKTAATGLNKAK